MTCPLFGRRRRRGGVGGGGHDKLCKLFWGVNIFSAPGMGRVSPKLVGQNKNALALPPLIFDRSLRVRSYGVICIWISVLRSLWIMNQRNRPMNSWPEWIHRFLWQCIVIWEILDHWSWSRSPQGNVPSERLRKRHKWNFCRQSSAACWEDWEVWKYLYLRWTVGDGFLFLYDLVSVCQRPAFKPLQYVSLKDSVDY